MNINRFFISAITATLLVSTLCVGCKKENSASIEPSATIEDTKAEENTDTEVKTRSLTISVLNFTNIDIGMFSVIDPVTNEQINTDGMQPGESISLECNWPEDTESFQWALYNTSGELCIDASTNIKDATKAVALAITGDTNVDNVEVAIE